MEQRMHVIVGHYGSGKTEFAINYAHALRQAFERVYIVDLDIVNPYFRTFDVKNALEEGGISVIASPYASSNVDVPALPAEVARVFSDRDAAVVFDVGGDDDGAIALGRYRQFFTREAPEVLFVINAFRPLSATEEQVTALLRDIEGASRLSVTGLVNSSNIAGETTLEHIVKGQTLTDEVSRKTGIPCRYVAGLEEILKELPPTLLKKGFPIKRYLSLPFR
ncbi:MAG: hypothetical protein E7414_02755 [Ruminococcaceae bacterium]|nr:hypothetical protein [Oscillospiraceae bacterium]